MASKNKSIIDVLNGLDGQYDNCWKSKDSVMVYIPQNYNFKNKLIFVDIHSGFLKMHSQKTSASFTIADIDFSKKIVEESVNANIIVTIHAIKGGSGKIECVKQKVSILKCILGIDFIVLVALEKNKYMKPHTGMWKLVKALYKANNINISACIANHVFVSDNGGCPIESKMNRLKKKSENSSAKDLLDVDTDNDEDMKENTTLSIEKNISALIKKRSQNQSNYRDNGHMPNFTFGDDYDRAFANNVGIKYMCINEFLDYDPPEMRWTSPCIVPDKRIEYVKATNEYLNSNVIHFIEKRGSENFLIFVMGPPRCGKTTFCRKFIEVWNSEELGRQNNIKHLELQSKFRGDQTSNDNRYVYVNDRVRANQAGKLLADRICVLVDGKCESKESRQKYLTHASKHGYTVIYIEIFVGFQLSYVLNHTAVEESRDGSVYLCDDIEYEKYKVSAEIPENDPNYLKYVPNIDDRPTITEYHY